ncbi:glycoside hydrolase family 68 protein, partial [Leuconostoc citreum]|uniref:glycoside hydrolase family 68 protein n=1 Tax=Leuconostoc citreum TaxID=33964 RepID=UPI0015DA7354
TADKAAPAVTAPTTADKAAPAVTAPTTADKAAPAVTAPTTADKAAPAVTALTAPNTARLVEKDLPANNEISGLTTFGNNLVCDAGLAKSDLIKNLSKDQIDAINQAATKYYDDPAKKPFSNAITYKDFDQLINQFNESPKELSVPKFNKENIKDMPSLTTKDAESNEVSALDMWDTWSVQDAKTKTVANVNGFQMMFGLAGAPTLGDTHMYMLYAKYGATHIEDWKMAGSVFGYDAVNSNQEWSGSAALNDDGSIQLFYTRVKWNSKLEANYQELWTANIDVSVIPDNEIQIKSINNDHSLFAGDGFYYEQLDQIRGTESQHGENFALRDPNIIETDSGRYLTFEAGTGQYRPSGKQNITDLSIYGGDLSYNVKAMLNTVSNSDWKSLAGRSNAALGLLKLSGNQSDPDVEKLYTPRITSILTSDEIERANIVPLNGKYYLFAAARFDRSFLGHSPKLQPGYNVMMLGYVSDKIDGDYRPLNGNGTVLVSNIDFNDRTATYAYYPVAVDGYSDRLLVTGYMSNRGQKTNTGYNATTAPSFIIQINADGTTAVEQTITTQND